MKKSFTLLAFLLIFFTTTSLAAQPKVLFYVPFNGTTDATTAGGNPQGTFGKGLTPQFADGISGQGLLSGGSNQHVVFDAAGNIPSDQWTITFWMKGLPGAQWNGAGTLQTFWELNGDDGFMWLYQYPTQTQPWLLSRQGNKAENNKTFLAPKVPEEQWHYWAVSWRKGSGAYVYVDGRLAGQSPCEPPQHIKSIAIGQRENPSVQNKIVDEFKIYDAAMDSGSIAQHYRQEGNFALNPELTVMPSRQKITIDGKIDSAEWQNAAGFDGLIDAQSWKIETPQTWGKITYDDYNLYLALHSDNPAESIVNPDTTAQHGFVKKDILQHDGDVKNDDHFFVQLFVDGKLYSILTNSIGTMRDAVTDTSKNDDVSWESGARVKSVLDKNGWSMEAAIPLKLLGLEHIADNATWSMNFGRVWKMLRQRTDLWSPGKRDDDQQLRLASGLGTVHFSSDPGAVVDLQQFEIKPDGHVAAQLNVYNPGNAAHEITVTLSAAAKVLLQQKVALNPGESKPVNLSALPKDADGGLIEITVRSGAKVLFHQSAPLILERVGQLSLWSYPSRQQVRLGWVIQSDAEPASLNLNIQFKDVSGKVVQQANVPHLPALNSSTLIDIKSLPPGNYTVDAQIVNGENVVQQQALPFEKQPLPSWLGNTLGISNTPPPPWTNVRFNKNADAVSIWGRTYNYGGKLLPEQIINQGKPMLAAPMKFVVNATQSTDSGKADSQWIKITAKRASSLRSQQVGSVKLTANSYTEFDGMTWMDVTAAPRSSKVLLNGLTFEIPLKAAWAKLIRPYFDYTMQQTGALPEKGWTGKANSMPWIGNGDGGIQFFLESTATWIGSKNIEIIPENNGAVVMRVNLIDAPATLDKPLHFAFGWITSPVKPAPKDARDWRLLSDPKTTPSYVQQAAAANPNLKWYLPWWQGWWWLPEKYTGNYDVTGPLPIPAGNEKENAARDYFGVHFYAAPYGRLSELGTANPWFAQFGDEWVPDTRKFVQDTTVAPNLRFTSVSQSSASLRDFYAWGYNQLLNEGNVHALYFDVSRPVSDTNIYHGAGTQMPDGSIEPSINILGLRETFERIYTLMKSKHPDGKIFYHMSGEIILPVDSFCDAMIDGENYTGILDRKENRGYEKVLSVDQFRAEYSAQNNFGPASVFLPEFERVKSITQDEWKTLGYQHADYLLGLIFLHDSNLWWTWMPTDHVAQVYSAFDAAGWNASWKFIPYWQQKYFSLPQNVYASLYQSPDDGKVLLVLMNTSGKEQEINLPMALDKSTFTSAKAVYPQQTALVQNGKFNAKIGDNNFAAFLLQK